MKKIYRRYKQIILYLIFGGLTTLVSIVTMVIGMEAFHWNALIANIFSWICAVTFAYITNRIWVFEGKNHGIHKIFREILAFYGGRITTLLLEEVILWVGITILDVNAVLVKILAQFLVMIGNYVISKYFVF